MAKTLLRSGCLDDFLALGENGQAVFDSAFQIRETLRLRKQQAVADALAIPQPNDEGDRVDWYAPQEGSVTSWAAASDEDRRTALRYLDNCLSNVASLSARCQRAEKTSIRLFGALLEKALQFPGSQHVYLVNGKPVITFWGFVNLNQGARDDVLECLRVVESREPEIAFIPEEALPEPEPLPVEISEPEKPLLEAPMAVQVDDDSPVYSLAAVTTVKKASAEEEAPAPRPEPAAIAAKPRRRWLLPIAAVIAVAVAAPVGYLLLSGSQTAPVAIAQTEVPPKPIAPAPIQAVDVAKTTLPLTPAEVVVPPKPEPAPVAAPEENPEPITVAADVPKNALILPAEAVKIGSTKFLNGTWRAQIDFSDPITGKAPSLRYQIANNKGTVRLVHGDNIVCKAEVFSGLHQNGALMIKTRGSARCSDGSRYPMPEVTCKTGSNGAAVCTGRYEGDKVIPITFRKVSN
ncbi:SrfA family protein [Cedecea neteri]|uniref:SrfA family protein n=1 Tax=Cedecea neteri TaxID=158822 RepID=UPI00289F964F|nr:SrfA family protein [Cedecea neteri]